MAENNSWLNFLRLLGEQRSREEARESGIYNLIIEHFPIQFMQKLLSTAVDNSTALSDRVHAADLIKELNGGGFVEKNYSNIVIDPQSLETLRRDALSLAVSYGTEAEIAVQDSGQELTFSLLQESLKAGEEWNEFLQFAAEGFAQISPSAANDVFLAVFGGLSRSHQHDLMGLMKSRIEQRREQFDEIVKKLLLEAKNEAPFLLLPSIIHTFDKKISLAITKVAVTLSPFMKYLKDMADPEEAVHVAHILADCIQHCDFISNTPGYADFETMDGAVSHVVHDLNNTFAILPQHTQKAKRAATRLTEAMRTKFTEHYQIRDDGGVDVEEEEEEEVVIMEEDEDQEQEDAMEEAEDDEDENM